MPHVPLHIHLGLFAVGRRGQRDDAENPRAYAFGNRLDDAALARAVAALEQDADLDAFGDDPKLQLDELGMQAREFALVLSSFLSCDVPRSSFLASRSLP
jgi:hypothetical protein